MQIALRFTTLPVAGRFWGSVGVEGIFISFIFTLPFLFCFFFFSTDGIFEETGTLMAGYSITSEHPCGDHTVSHYF
jgi:hypothetical protein